MTKPETLDGFPALTLSVVKGRIEIRHPKSGMLIYVSRKPRDGETLDDFKKRIAKGFAGTEEMWSKRSEASIKEWMNANAAVFVRWQKALFSLHADRDKDTTGLSPQTSKPKTKPRKRRAKS